MTSHSREHVFDLYGQRVFVYRNLHKNCWSIQNTSSGRVIAHVAECLVTSAILVVRPAGRDQVRRTRRKNVHAGVRGTLQPYHELSDSHPVPITYNPYTNDTFVRRDTGMAVVSAEAVILGADGKRVALCA